MVFLSPFARSFELPDGYTIGKSSLFFAKSLQEISVPNDIQLSNDIFAQAKHDYYVSIGSSGKEREFQSITVRWRDGTSCSFPGKLIRSIRLIQQETVEVKSGTELLYLELYLAGKIIRPEQVGNFLKSAFQIISYLIEQNDLNRFRRVLEYGGLVTDKNYSRLRKYARELGRNDIVDLINGAMAKD